MDSPYAFSDAIEMHATIAIDATADLVAGRRPATAENLVLAFMGLSSQK
jgi:hypothetical protein